MNTAEKWHGTTIVLLRKNNETIVVGDGQVSLGNTVLKSKAKKVANIAEGQVMMYHKRFAINFICAPRISRSGLPF